MLVQLNQVLKYIDYYRLTPEVNTQEKCFLEFNMNDNYDLTKKYIIKKIDSVHTTKQGNPVFSYWLVFEVLEIPIIP